MPTAASIAACMAGVNEVFITECSGCLGFLLVCRNRHLSIGSIHRLPRLPVPLPPATFPREAVLRMRSAAPRRTYRRQPAAELRWHCSVACPPHSKDLPVVLRVLRSDRILAGL